jgi:DnaJ-class molecular chaperone
LRILAVRCGARLKTIKINHAAFNISNFGSYLIPLDEYKFTTHISRIAIHSFVVLCLLVVACKSCKYGSQFPIILGCFVKSTVRRIKFPNECMYTHVEMVWGPFVQAGVQAGYRSALWRACLYTVLVCCIGTVWLGFRAEGSLENSETYYSLLGVTIEVSKEDIKKAFRKLVLELHPDKLAGQNLTHEEEEESKNRFIKVTDAYEVLIDDEKRKEYDYSLSGVDYKFVEIPEEVELVRKKPFKLYAKSYSTKLRFEAQFPVPLIPDLNIVLKADFKDSLQAVAKTQQYFRRRICPDCKGIGGVPGTCGVCGGDGIEKKCCATSVHESCISTTCHACTGKGYQLNSKCTRCSAKGFIMEEGSVTVDIPLGTRNGYKVVIENAGHEALDGSRGKAVIELQWALPPGWSVDLDTGHVMYIMTVAVESMLQGYESKLYAPTGESIDVSVLSGAVSVWAGVVIARRVLLQTTGQII